ncbi:MAG: hypothetical protein RUMPE_01300 [Eubacteriales bacterium SKADARSKE-1]|nr:hypothetical protein [Eubacteriales bacterium SKADARSKE-1]
MISTVNDNNNKIPNIPMGLGMALAQNIDSMDYFNSLSEDERQEVINHTHTVQSKQDMQNYVGEMSDSL